MAPRKNASPPRGREAVVDAVCKAAAELFAERGPSAVSSRDIAAAAGVNYGLIHRHFGGRDELLRQVMLRLAEDLGRAFDQAEHSGRSPIETLAENPTYARALAHAALDGVDMATLQERHPVMDRFLERLLSGASMENELDTRISGAVAVSTVLGWAVFGSFIGPAMGLEDVDESTLNSGLDARLLRILRPS